MCLPTGLDRHCNCLRTAGIGSRMETALGSLNRTRLDLRLSLGFSGKTVRHEEPNRIALESLEPAWRVFVGTYSARSPDQSSNRRQAGFGIDMGAHRRRSALSTAWDATRYRARITAGTAAMERSEFCDLWGAQRLSQSRLLQ